MLKKIIFFSGVFLLIITLASCSQSINNETIAEPSNSTNVDSDQHIEKTTVSHEWGDYQIEKQPENIVTLDFSFLDTLTALGVTPIGNAGVGTTKIPDYLTDKVNEVSDVGERKAPNLEVIHSLNPDVIIASVDRHSMIQTELEDISSTIAFDDANFEQILSNVKSIGAIVGKEEVATQVITELEDKVNKAKDTINNSPSILVVGYFDDEFTVWVENSFIGTLLSEIGFEYAFNGEVAALEGKGEGVKMTLEKLHEINPDYIMIYGDDYSKLKSNPLFKELTSVKEKHFLDVDRDLWSRARGPIAGSKIIDEALSVISTK